MERMEFPSKYTDTVKSNNLNGSTLIFSNADDLKDLLDMTLAEWTTFRLHFLGLPPHFRPQRRNMLPAAYSHMVKRTGNHLSHQDSSNHSLYSCVSRDPIIP